MITSATESLDRTRQRPRGRPGRSSLVAVLAVGGGALLIAGALLPWLTLYAGLQALRGTEGASGVMLIGGGVLSMVLGLAAVRVRLVGRLVPIVGFALLAYGVYLLVQLVGLFRELAAQPLDVAALGPGLPVALVGAGLVAATGFVPSAVAHPEPGSRGTSALLGAVQLALAALLAAAGIAHLYLTPEHLGESTLLGIGFAAAGVVQLVLAGMIILRPDRRLLLAIIAVNVILIVLYAWNVLLGLPIVGPGAGAVMGAGHEVAEHAHESGLVIGLGEPVDLAGVLTKAAELLAVAGSVALLRFGRRGN